MDAFDIIGGLLGGADATLGLVERYRQHRRETDYQAVKRGLVEVLLLRSVAPSLADELARGYLRVRSSWRDQLGEATTFQEYVECFDRLGVIGDDGLTADQTEIVTVLVALSEAQSDRGTRAVLFASRGIEGKVDTLLALAQRPAPVPSARPGNVLDAGESLYGEESLVLGQVGIPLVTPWTAHLETVFQSRAPDHGARYDAWRTDADPSLTPVERAVRHAVAGETDAALTLLEAVETSDWPPERQVARLRLLGTLERERGHSPRAQRHYEAARDRLPRIAEPAKSWLERRLLLDLNSVRGEDDSIRDTLERHELMLGVNAWYSIPVVDALTSSFSADVAREALQQRFRGTRAWRTSNLLYDAWLTFLKATHFAYAAGDHYSARDAHQSWGRTLLALPDLPLVQALDALWMARDGDTLVRVLRMRLGEAAGALDWSARLLARPSHPRGTDAEQWHLLVLRVMPLLAPLLPDDTVDQLRTELVEGFVRYHPELRMKENRSEFTTPFVQGRTYSSTYAVDALRALGAQRPLESSELTALVTSLRDVEPSPFSAWPVLAAHDWRPQDLEAARQAADHLIRVHPSWHPEEGLELLKKLALAYPDESFSEDVVRQLAATPPERLGTWERWRLRLDPPLPAAEAQVRAEAHTFLNTFVAHLTHTTGEEGLVLNRSHAVRFLPRLLALEPPVLTPEAVGEAAQAILNATNRAALPEAHRRDALRSLRYAWPHLPGAVRAELTAALAKMPAGALLAHVPAQMEQEFAPAPAEVPLERLLLRVAAGLEVRPADRAVLTQALLSGHAPDVEVAVSALQVVLEGGHISSADWLPLLLPAARSGHAAASRALYLLARFCPDDEGFRGVVAEVARQVLHTAPPPLGNVSGVGQGVRALPVQHPLRLALHSEVEGVRVHAHRHLRAIAHDVLNGICTV